MIQFDDAVQKVDGVLSVQVCINVFFILEYFRSLSAYQHWK